MHGLAAELESCMIMLMQVLVKESLPRTASNKVMRRVLRDEMRAPKAKL